MQELGPIFGLLADRGIDPPAARAMTIGDVALALGVGRRWVKARKGGPQVRESEPYQALRQYGQMIPRPEG